MKVLIIRADDTTEVADVINLNLDWLQHTVGGYIEGFYGRSGWHGYCNEEGKLLGLPANNVATAFAKELGWRSGGDVLAGDVVFLGTGADGAEDSVPVWLLHELSYYLGG